MTVPGTDNEDNVLRDHVARVFSDTDGGKPSGDELGPGYAEAGAKPASEGQAQEGEGEAPEAASAAGDGATPSPDQATDGGPGEGVRPPATVPIQAHDAERAAHKTTKEELERTRGTMTNMETTLQRIMGLPQMQQPVASAAAPTREDAAKAMAEDPQGFIMDALGTISQRQDAFERGAQANTQRTAASQQIVSAYAGAAQEFMAAGHADYPQAREHLLASRRGELQMLGYQPAQAEQILDAEEASTVQMALSQNANPAERLYAVAQSRGYKPGAVLSTPGNGAAAMTTLQAGAAAATSLGSGSGEAKAGPMTLEGLASITDHGDFLVAFEAMRKAGRLG